VLDTSSTSADPNSATYLCIAQSLNTRAKPVAMGNSGYKTEELHLQDIARWRDMHRSSGRNSNAPAIV
jgi:hypothetical protein